MGLGLLQLSALTALGVVLLSLAVLCLPLAVLCLVAALAGATGGIFALIALLIEPQPWLLVTLAAAVWLPVVGVIAAAALAILSPGGNHPGR